MVRGPAGHDGPRARRGGQDRDQGSREKRHPRPRPASSVQDDVRGRVRGAALAPRGAGRAGDPRAPDQVADVEGVREVTLEEAPLSLATAPTRRLNMIEAIN